MACMAWDDMTSGGMNCCTLFVVPDLAGDVIVQSSGLSELGMEWMEWTGSGVVVNP